MIKTFEETFVSPFFKDTESEALRVLEQIRFAHPAEIESKSGKKYGWIEIDGYVEQAVDEDGNLKWRAVRVHELHMFDD